MFVKLPLEFSTNSSCVCVLYFLYVMPVMVRSGPLLAHLAHLHFSYVTTWSVRPILLVLRRPPLLSSTFDRKHCAVVISTFLPPQYKGDGWCACMVSMARQWPSARSWSDAASGSAAIQLLWLLSIDTQIQTQIYKYYINMNGHGQGHGHSLLLGVAPSNVGKKKLGGLL